MLDSCVFWQMARLSRVLPSRSRFMFAEQDSTGVPPLTLHADLVPVTSADAPGVTASTYRDLQPSSIDETVSKKKFACCNLIELSSKVVLQNSFKI